MEGNKININFQSIYVIRNNLIICITAIDNDNSKHIGMYCKDREVY